MKTIHTIAALILLAGIAGCRSHTTAAPGETAPAQRTPEALMSSAYATPDEAANALITAVQSDSKNAVEQVLGPGSDQIFTGDDVQDRKAMHDFAAAATEQHHLEAVDENTQRLVIGKNNWPTPIPIVKTADGKWHFDTHAGLSTILARRIGRNELNAIGICREYVEAQREFASKDRNGDDVLEYAQHFISKPGRHDGLYWRAAQGEEQSPYGPAIAKAEAEGYKVGHHTPYHGYYFHILRAQGPNVPGGAYSYVINGHMIAGFALVAYPADYGKSGIMTFVVNQRGRVYQKDLGTDTAEIARNMKEYNPDRTWTLVRN
jgi:hypothetical protein